MTKIDLVYLWCDSTDEEWSAKRKRFQQYDCIEETAAADCRFINNNELLFSMRSVAKFVPWVNHIYLITDHQIPSWLNVEHPKIRDLYTILAKKKGGVSSAHLLFLNWCHI